MLKTIKTIPNENSCHHNEENAILEDIVINSELQSTMDEFYKLTGFGIGILNNQGKVLVATGWQDICVNFHRAHSDTSINCIESDIALTKGLLNGEIKQYKCKNNMWDIMTPIFLEEKHIGNICHGQFFFEDEVIDYDFYRQQAKRYGFDEQEYLQALAKVPVRSRETIVTLMNFYIKFAYHISTTSSKNMRLSQLLCERDHLVESLHNNETQLIITSQEISAAYQQLEASDEELQAQYHEIHNSILEIEKLNVKYEHLSYYDHLTNLPNRRKLIEKLSEEILSKKCGALILLDVDNFKDINDTLGHIYGDKVLQKIAQELEQVNTNQSFIARIGGDEFIIILPEEQDMLTIDNYAKQILKTLNKGLDIEGNEVYINCSMGISLYPLDSTDINQLLMNVDMAMYTVKKAGKNNHLFFHRNMIEKLKEQLQIEKLLREALRKNGFKILYQPQVCTYTGKVIGFEALIRLKNNSMSPGLFIPVAEQTGLIIEIGRWVTKEVINQIALWDEMGLDIQPVSINFSAQQLNDTTYLDFLAELLEQKQVKGKYLEIEITESVFLEKRHDNILFLNKFKKLGVNLALDDFGTGYSSLSYLTFLPINKIKLDKSLSDKFLELEHIKFMEGIISLAHNLNMKVVAEGIEKKEHYTRLKAGKCDYIQGFLFSKPIPAAEVEQVLKFNFPLD